MKKLTTKRRREIESEITEISDKIFALCEETGLCIDIAHYNGKKEYPCIFLHDNESDTIKGVYARKDIPGAIDNRKFGKVAQGD